MTSVTLINLLLPFTICNLLENKLNIDFKLQINGEFQDLFCKENLKCI